jgi:phage antirepressor YoqD-like protein
MFDSHIQSTQTSTLDLTPYNVDGLELFFTSNRKVRASQSAIARMCDVSEATIRNRCSEPIVKNDPKCDVVYAQTSSTGGGKQSKLHNSRTIKILLKEFNPSLWEQMEDFGIDEGLAQMAGVPIITPTAPPIPPTRRELAAMLLDAEIRAEKAEKQIEADSDFTNLGKLIDNTVGCVTVGEFAKVIEVGRSTYFNELRHCKILMKNSVIPFQNMMAAGYFVVTEKIGLNNIAYPTTLITAKGQTYLAKRHKQYLAKELVTVQMEREVNLV